MHFRSPVVGRPRHRDGNRFQVLADIAQRESRRGALVHVPGRRRIRDVGLRHGERSDAGDAWIIEVGLHGIAKREERAEIPGRRTVEDADERGGCRPRRGVAADLDATLSDAQAERLRDIELQRAIEKHIMAGRVGADDEGSVGSYRGCDLHRGVRRKLVVDPIGDIGKRQPRARQLDREPRCVTDPDAEAADVRAAGGDGVRDRRHDGGLVREQCCRG